MRECVFVGVRVECAARFDDKHTSVQQPQVYTPCRARTLTHARDPGDQALAWQRASDKHDCAVLPAAQSLAAGDDAVAGQLQHAASNDCGLARCRCRRCCCWKAAASSEGRWTANTMPSMPVCGAPRLQRSLLQGAHAIQLSYIQL